MQEFDAVVVAGGRARRMGGADKPMLPVGDRTMLDRVIDAAGDAASVVVVGPRRATRTPVAWALEQPAGSGPAAAVAAGLASGEAPIVVLLAADLPFVSRAVVAALVAAVGDGDGAALVDDTGRGQHLCSAWRRDRLTAAAARLGTAADISMRRLLEPLTPVPVAVEADGPPPWLDCDTPEDLAAARETP